jgi:Ca2+-binding EF-hand superfamily protein
LAKLNIGNTQTNTNLLNRLDSNGDGSFTLEELCGVIATIQAATQQQTLALASTDYCAIFPSDASQYIQSIFIKADSNQDDLITEADLQLAIGNEPLSHRAFVDADTNGDGYISLNDLCHLSLLANSYRLSLFSLG